MHVGMRVLVVACAVLLGACVSTSEGPNYNVPSLDPKLIATDGGGHRDLAPAVFETISPGAPCVRCGVERWRVKTLTDSDAAAVNFTAETTTVGQLVALPRPEMPRTLASDHRFGPVEFQTYTVQAWLVAWRLEADRDLVLGLQDVNSTQVVRAESVSPNCTSACTSAKLAQFTEVRQRLDRCLRVAKRWARPRDPIKLEVTGVAFFDIVHGQSYASASNGIELHPVLSVNRLSGPCPAIPMNP